MALSKPVTDMKLLLCPLCTETLKSPKILPCLHTLCEKCIYEYATNLKRGIAGKKDKLTEFSCPVCRTVVKHDIKETESESQLASSLHTNQTILAMLATTKRKKGRDCEPCKRHQQSAVATLWCKDCQEAFCEDCDVKHSWWLKFNTHKVIPLKEFGLDTYGIDLSVISEKCPVHPNKVIDCFCYDHKQLCCISCLTLEHRTCSTVKAIEDIIESTEIKHQLDSLNETKEEATKLLKAKKKELEVIGATVGDTEEAVEKFVKSQKCKLDELFENFIKQLHTLRDEQEKEVQVRIRLLEQLINNLEHGLSTADVVKNSGSKAQLLTYLKTTETQLSSRIRELQKEIGNEKLVKVTFKKHKVLQQLDTIKEIGRIEISKESIAEQMKPMLKSSLPLWWMLKPSFNTLTIEKVKTVYINGSDFKCGVCIDEKHMILGDLEGNNLHLFDKDDDEIISSISFDGDMKRLCYLPQQKRIFIACDSDDFYCASSDGEHIDEPLYLEFNEYAGGLQSFDDDMYVITDGEIKTFSTTVDPEELTEMNSCFETNTECGLNSLGVHNGELVYTTVDHEIKRTTLEGNEIYCYKNATIKTPECIAVLPSGMVLIVDRDGSGSLHLLSENGTRSKILLEKFESIEDPQDIWLDLDEETFYVAGGEFIEVFKVI